jgi:hypothetical protein
MKTKAIIISVIALVVLSLAGVLGVRNVRANESGIYPSIVQKLVERFNLDTEEVQQVFDETKEERHQQMQARFEERLDQAVSDGQITEDQKEAIIAKKAEMQTNHQEFKDLTPEEKQAKMAAYKEEMEAWAEENGLDLSTLHMLGGGHHGGFGKPHFGW